MNEPWNGSVFPEGCVVGCTERQIPNETDNGLDQWPTGGRMHEPDNGGEATLEPHGVLRHFTLGVTRRQVAEGAHCRLSYFLSENRTENKLEEKTNII